MDLVGDLVIAMSEIAGLGCVTAAVFVDGWVDASPASHFGGSACL